MAPPKKKQKLDGTAGAGDASVKSSKSASKRAAGVKLITTDTTFLTFHRSSKSKRSAPAAPVCDDLFRKLAPELRNRIYDLVLLEDKAIAVHYMETNAEHARRERSKKSWLEPGLLRVTKWIRQEAYDIYYRGNTFSVALSPAEFEELTKASLTDIHSWVVFAKLCCDIDLGLEPGFLMKEREESFIRTNCGTLHMQALEEVVQLGLAARKGEWFEVQLEMEFEEWVEEVMGYSRNKQLRDQMCRGLEPARRRMMEADWVAQEDEYTGGVATARGAEKRVLRSSSK